MNEIERTPRSDSILKNLPEERQAEILKYCQSHTQKQTVEWLGREGVQLSGPTISHWRSWYLSRKAWREQEENVLDHMLDYKKRHPSLTKKNVADMSEYLFNVLAIHNQDVKTWSVAQQVQIKRDEHKLRGKKMKLELRKYKDQAAKAREAVSSPTLTPEEKEQRVKQILGIS